MVRVLVTIFNVDVTIFQMGAKNSTAAEEIPISVWFPVASFRKWCY